MLDAVYKKLIEKSNLFFQKKSMIYDIISLYLEADNSFIEYIQFGERPRTHIMGVLALHVAIAK